MRIYIKGARSVYLLKMEMGAMKILIVEDEVEYGWLLAKFLMEKGYLTEHVASGKSAIEHLESHTKKEFISSMFI